MPTKYYESSVNKCKTGSRKTWSTLNEILNKPHRTRTFPDYFTADVNQVSDQFTTVNKFKEYFTNIGPDLANQIRKKYFKDYLDTKHDSVFTFHEINNMDIVNVIDHLHAKCSCGNDGISTKLFKLMKDALVEPLKLLIN